MFGKRWTSYFIRKNCWQQDIENKERWIVAGQTLLFLVGMDVFYYRSFWVFPLLLPIGFVFYQGRIQGLERKKKEEFIRQFQDFLQLLKGSLVAGYSFENSMKEAEREMNLLYHTEIRLKKELRHMNHQLQMQIPIEQIWRDFSERVKLEDIQLFTQVFLAGKKRGGNLVEIIKETGAQISEKIEVMGEIHLIMTGKLYELEVMKWIPFGILLYITLSFPEFVSGLYGNMIGRIVMTFCLVLYLLACFWGEKILSIEV